MFNYFYLPSLLSWCYLQCVSHDKKKKRHSLEEIDKDVVQSKSKTPLMYNSFLKLFFCLFCFVLCCCCCCSNKFAEMLATSLEHVVDFHKGQRQTQSTH